MLLKPQCPFLGPLLCSSFVGAWTTHYTSCVPRGKRIRIAVGLTCHLVCGPAYRHARVQKRRWQTSLSLEIQNEHATGEAVLVQGSTMPAGLGCCRKRRPKYETMNVGPYW